MDIKEFLKEFPLISPGSIESSLGIPHGTIRLNSDKPIPEKYRELIIESLDRYVAIRKVVVEESIQEKVVVSEIKSKTGKEYVVRRINKLGIGEHAYVFGKMENGIFKRDNDIPDGSIVII
jgi:hypothetical protein